MSNFILIAVCMGAGFLFRRSRTLPRDAQKSINAWIIYIALPAVSFKYIPHIEWNKTLLLPAIAPIVVFFVGWLFVELYAKLKGNVSPTSKAALILTAGLSNTSFVGFPLIMAYYGEDPLSIAIICDQITFLLLSTIGLVVAIKADKSRELTFSDLFKKISTFPPLLACIGALVLPSFIDLSNLDPLFDKLANTVGPLALFSIGLQLKFAGWKGEKVHIISALTYKLTLAPAIILGIVLCLGLKGIIPEISIFEMAMPTLLSSGIIADKYHVNPKLANLIIGIGIIIAMITTGIWYLVLATYNN